MEKLYTLTEVAQCLKASPYTVRDWRKRGLIVAVRVGKNWRVTQSELTRISNEGMKHPA